MYLVSVFFCLKIVSVKIRENDNEVYGAYLPINTIFVFSSLLSFMSCLISIFPSCISLWQKTTGDCSASNLLRKNLTSSRRFMSAKSFATSGRSPLNFFSHVFSHLSMVSHNHPGSLCNGTFKSNNGRYKRQKYFDCYVYLHMYRYMCIFKSELHNPIKRYTYVHM